MTRIISATRVLPVLVGVLSTSVLLAAPASAAIIGIRSAQSCNVYGLNSSPATAVSGVHCDPNYAGTSTFDPFSLTDLLNGSIALYVGNSKTPSWNLVNDTGAPLTSLTLYYSGALAPNSVIDLQVRDPFLSGGGVATPDITAQNPALPLQMMWNGGTGLGVGEVFNVWTASFAHKGADAGCISGTSDCKPKPPVPVPDGGSMAMLLGIALIGLAGARRMLK